ncbi:MAG TPA: cyclic nucleotide-binding domain-containing protein [Acidimicrobiales bacterium]|jgi:CRP-like cAMP-binding protein|nr:cyclic nucleotide-binding domain-containing protein [Acidimicrobiales bacterium]
MALRPRQNASVDHLRGVKEFGACSPAELMQVAALAEHLHVTAGEILTREGRIDREFFLILSGSVSVTQKGHQVNLLGAGDFFGELAAVHSTPRNATVTALTDMEVLIIGPRELATISEIPSFRSSLMEEMARRQGALDTDVARTVSGASR